ncbi:MAG: glycosyltransferase family 4 protein [candidate division Zixibacteria bacterium]|nr:glycosyltransferase family 4 protein [candidate division Zixibacteria bacterium]
MALTDQEFIIESRRLTTGDRPAISMADSAYRDGKEPCASGNHALWPSFRNWIIRLIMLLKSIPRYRRIRITYRSGANFFSEIVPAALLGRFFGRELILSYRSNRAEAELEDYGRGMQPFLRLFHRIEVPCDHAARVFRRYNLKATVVPPVVNDDLFSFCLRMIVQPRIVTARRLERGSNIVGLIKAFRFIKQKYPRAELTILGDGPQREWLEWFIDSEHIHGVTLAGRVSHEEVARHFTAADLYANASTIDSLPLSMLEALRAGLPVVTTNAGQISEIIDDRINGLLVPINDHHALADRIIELVKNPSLVTRLSEAAGKGSK